MPSAPASPQQASLSPRVPLHLPDLLMLFMHALADHRQEHILLLLCKGTDSPVQAGSGQMDELLK